MKKKNFLPILLMLWASLAVFAWLGPKQDISQAERRPLAQFPKITVKSILNGKFMEDFEDFSLDQFPLRDGFRRLKSEFHLYFLRQSDNNGIYLTEGHAVRQEYPLDMESVDYAIRRFAHVYDKYLQNNEVYMAIIPDKGYYLADSAEQLKMDYATLFEEFRQRIPWATHIDLTDVLSAEDYYRTDTHWRQERILPAAERICDILGVSVGQYTEKWLDTAFYGVYYGQAALPMEPDSICVLENEMLAKCSVYDYESGKTLGIYDLEKLTGKDPYEVFLSGSRGLLEITNPEADGDRHLIVFRDSFGSAIIPLLLTDFSRITVVDIRYIQPDLLNKYVTFADAVALFLYSTPVLNNSETIK